MLFCLIYCFSFVLKFFQEFYQNAEQFCPRFVGPYLGQNCMQRLSVEDSGDRQRAHTCKKLKAEVQGCRFYDISTVLYR